MEAFLDSLRKKTAKNTYKRGIDLFVTFYGKDIDAILEERKGDLTPRPNESLVDVKQRADRYEKLLEKFYSWLEEKGYDKANSRYSFCKGLRSCLLAYQLRLRSR